MPPNPRKRPACRFCFAQSTTIWMVKQKTERLILLVMGVILNMTVINQAVMLMDNENAFYCPVHFFYAAKVLDKIMKVRSDGTVSSVGLSILQVLANKVLVDFVEKRSLYWSLRRFMALYSESSELEFNKTGKLTRGSYQPFTLGDVSIHYCIECLSPKPFGEIHFLRDRLHKVAFAIYAGPCLQKMLSVEQAHAVVALPEIPVCSCHLFKMACVLDTLVPRLHRVQERKEFTECMMNCFGKGWMSSLKAVYAFRDKYIEEKPNTHTCKFCGQTDGNVKDDRQLNISAHHACFKNRVCDVLWQLRYVKKSTNAAVEVHVPMPGEFEFWTNGMLDRLLIEMNRYFPQQGQLSKAEQRVNCIVMFARYYSENDVWVTETREAEARRLEVDTSLLSSRYVKFEGMEDLVRGCKFGADESIYVKKQAPSQFC